MEEFVVTCHCGNVRGRFSCNASKIIAWDCDCSDCKMRRNVHVIIPERDFTLDMPPGSSLEDATTLYLWGTKTAQRRFCKTCGVLPWYRPRSNPDGYAVTINCVDWTKGGTLNPPPKILVQTFDGVHWEQTMKAMQEGKTDVNISEQSK